MLIRLAALLFPVAAMAGPVFEPVPVSEHVYDGGWEHYVGGGAAAFDCNGDHLPDLFAAGGANQSTLFLNESARGGAVRFTVASDALPQMTAVIGAYPIDIDSDGLIDLAVLRAGENVLLQGQGDCHFRPFDALDVSTGDRWTTAFSATWEQGQALPTLAFGNYVDRTNPKGPFETCDDNVLFRPTGTGYAPGQTLSPGFCTLSILFSDWGRTGRADLRVSNDRHYYVRGGQEQMWAMEGTPRLYGPDEGWNRFQIWGMGIASRDISGDGVPEIYLTSMGDQKLQALAPGAQGPRFQDETYARGTTAHRPHVGDDGRPSTGWHVAFGDVQNDGLDDIFVAKGNVEQMPDAAMKDPNSLLVQQQDGTFAEASVEAGLASFHRSRGAALADFNLDGRLDLAVVNRRAPFEVYQNITAPVGHWLGIELAKPAPNTRAIGAWIELQAGARTYVRELTVGGGHAGGSATPEHFGLGEETTAQVRVIWPDGKTGPWHDVSAGSYYRLERTEAGEDLSPY